MVGFALSGLGWIGGGQPGALPRAGVGRAVGASGRARRRMSESMACLGDLPNTLPGPTENVEEPNRFCFPAWMGGCVDERADAAATHHEGRVKVEAASSRLPSMVQRGDAAAALARAPRTRSGRTRMLPFAWILPARRRDLRTTPHGIGPSQSKGVALAAEGVPCGDRPAKAPEVPRAKGMEATRLESALGGAEDARLHGR